MKTPQVAVAALAGLLALGVGGCSKGSALGSTTATVTIDGTDTGGAHAVRCHQNEWAWTIETPDKERGFSAVLATDGPPTARSVQFRDFGGFSGTFWEDNIGRAEVTGRNGHYTITGTADGNFTRTPSDSVTAEFRIQANC